MLENACDVLQVQKRRLTSRSNSSPDAAFASSANAAPLVRLGEPGAIDISLPSRYGVAFEREAA